MLHPLPRYYMRPGAFKTLAYKLASVNRSDIEEEDTVRQIARTKGSLLKPYDFDHDFNEIMHFFVPTLARIYLDQLGEEDEHDFFKRLKEIAMLWCYEGDLNGFPNYKKKRKFYTQRIKDEAKEVARRTQDPTFPFACQIPPERLLKPWQADFDSIDHYEHKEYVIRNIEKSVWRCRMRKLEIAQRLETHFFNTDIAKAYIEARQPVPQYARPCIIRRCECVRYRFETRY
ncbi:hypothetical protein BKA70DRAFT_1442054 [Coprinopsis sp. MPI-PUGE-AT-0042]|nr:hypothetical protein BKA70DRAFT_1442054 [Coprinopsis sp. MPI-PUGE-AT-0042]